MDALHKCFDCGKKAPLYSIAANSQSRSVCKECFNEHAPKLGLTKIKEDK